MYKLKQTGVDKKRRDKVKKWLQEIEDEGDSFDVDPDSTIGFFAL